MDFVSEISLMMMTKGCRRYRHLYGWRSRSTTSVS